MMLPRYSTVYSRPYAWETRGSWTRQTCVTCRAFGGGIFRDYFVVNIVHWLDDLPVEVERSDRADLLILLERVVVFEGDLLRW